MYGKKVESSMLYLVLARKGTLTVEPYYQYYVYIYIILNKIMIYAINVISHLILIYILLVHYFQCKCKVLTKDSFLEKNDTETTCLRITEGDSNNNTLPTYF